MKTLEINFLVSLHSLHLQNPSITSLLLVNCLYTRLDDGGGLRQGPNTRAMFRHLEAKKESEALVQIKMLTILSFEDSCKNCEK